MSVANGIQSLARILGLSTKRAVYDDEAKLLICAEASNRIRFLEEEILRRLESRFGDVESRQRWLRILQGIGDRVAGTLANLRDQVAGTTVKKIADIAAESAVTTCPTSLASMASMEVGDGIFRPIFESSYTECLKVTPRHAAIPPARFVMHEHSNSDVSEVLEKTAYPSCLKVTSHRTSDLTSPVAASRDRFHASPRVSPRILPSPRATSDHVRMTPFGFQTPSSASRLSSSRLSSASPLSETRRTIKGRASRKLSFDGQTEGECAEAAGFIRATHSNSTMNPVFMLRVSVLKIYSDYYLLNYWVSQ